MRKLSARETVLELLRTYQDVVCPLEATGEWLGGGGRGKPGHRVLWRAQDAWDKHKHWYYEGSYRELEIVLVRMRAGVGAEGDDRYNLAKAYWAVAESFIRCERRMVEREVRRKARNHKWVTLTERYTEPVANTAVRQEDLEAGLDWITAEFGRLGYTPFLPKDFLDAAMAAVAA